jgi:predicted AAA+ superfamily ATPase
MRKRIEKKGIINKVLFFKVMRKSVEKGFKVFIRGPRRAGKTCLMKALIRFSEEKRNQDEIRLDLLKVGVKIDLAKTFIQMVKDI